VGLGAVAVSRLATEDLKARTIRERGGCDRRRRGRSWG
jgi:hypothetical protein